MIGETTIEFPSGKATLLNLQLPFSSIQIQGIIDLVCYLDASKKDCSLYITSQKTKKEDNV